uniref:BolA-like protein n=1 Tax=Panagrolaimus sp. JU765 TaxID=591449 RepID=A0AC34RS84_9BILA
MFLTRRLFGMSTKVDAIKRLMADFEPKLLEVKCESDAHNVPKGSEMHFYVGVVSNKFQGVSTLQRHRMISKKIYTEVPGVHALRIFAKTPDEAQDFSEAPDAPKCLGGGRR